MNKNRLQQLAGIVTEQTSSFEFSKMSTQEQDERNEYFRIAHEGL
jgi:hypothetical protein